MRANKAYYGKKVRPVDILVTKSVEERAFVRSAPSHYEGDQINRNVQYLCKNKTLGRLGMKTHLFPNQGDDNHLPVFTIDRHRVAVFHLSFDQQFSTGVFPRLVGSTVSTAGHHTSGL